MTECDEVARAMFANYLAWLDEHAMLRTMQAARSFVLAQMPDESAVVRDNVAHSLYRLSGRIAK